jgi:uridine kinase
MIYMNIAHLLNTGKPAVIAIDGRCASGKSTAAAKLADLHRNAAIIKTDDFFLPPELRTPERYEEPGGNVHYERLAEFMAEINKTKETAETGNSYSCSYRVFDCGTMAYSGLKEITVTSGTLIIVEGSYCLRPELRGFYDYKIFMDIPPEEQARRIKIRNGEEMHKMFAEKWIPLEERYFKAYSVADCCDLIITKSTKNAKKLK